MIRQRLGRLATISTSAAFALMLLGVGTVSASPPNWVLTVVKLPSVVSPGADAGYRVTIANNGPSNISSLFLVSDQTAQPSFVGTPTQGSCNATGALSCSYGALTAGSSVTVTVAYATGSGSTFKIQFQGNSNGATFSDTKGRSHGDTLASDPAVTTTALSSSANFKGGFAFGQTTFADDQNVTRQNPQATTVVSPENNVPVTVEDGITTGVNCIGASCAGLFGEWSKVNVADGKSYGAAFKLTLLLYSKAVPNGVDASQIKFTHVLDNGTTEVISTQCTYAAGVLTNAQCLTVTKIGQNWKIDVWLFQNGFGRGGI